MTSRRFWAAAAAVAIALGAPLGANAGEEAEAESPSREGREATETETAQSDPPAADSEEDPLPPIPRFEPESRPAPRESVGGATRGE